MLPFTNSLERNRAGALVLLTGFVFSGCGQIAWHAADQASRYSTRVISVPQIQVPDGYRAVRVAAGFNYPSSIAWDADGQMYVLESHTIPIPMTSPRILRVNERGRIEKVRIDGGLRGASAVGIAIRDGWIWVSHEEMDGTFSISRVRTAGGALETVLRGLPSQGDHDVNHLVFDESGTLYFGQGSVTNSGLPASADPVNQKWIRKHPDLHEIPCAGIVLTGATFTDENELTDDRNDRATTGAYQAYGESGAERIEGAVPCNASIMRWREGLAAPELVAWGLRNPVALAIDDEGQLYVGTHGADVRSTRPIQDDPDGIHLVRQGEWYGWPDYTGSLEPVTAAAYAPPQKFLAEGHSSLGFVIDHAASGLDRPDVSLRIYATEPHAAVGGMDFVPATARDFAQWNGFLLISEMGDFRPTTDPTQPEKRSGFQIEAIDPRTKQATIFARNKGGDSAEPASTLNLEDAFERPVDVKVGPDGMIYVLDYGVFVPTEKAARVFPKTGKVFRIEPVTSDD